MKETTSEDCRDELRKVEVVLAAINAGLVETVLYDGELYILDKSTGQPKSKIGADDRVYTLDEFEFEFIERFNHERKGHPCLNMNGNIYRDAVQCKKVLAC